MPGFDYASWTGMLAPAKTPMAVISRLNAESVRAMQGPEMKALLATEGAEPVGSSPQQFAEQIRTEIARWTQVVKAAGIRPN
jgi:tripartite-type tricarboxylate transporter receptor subunit TctC